MRINFSGAKEGHVEIRIEGPEDLWHLSSFLRVGDRIGKRVLRTRKEQEGSERKGKEKVSVYLQVGVKEIRYEKELKRLRVFGEIVGEHGEVENGHHTISLMEGDGFTVSRRWSDALIRELQELERKKRYCVFVVLVDREGASFALLNETGVSEMGELESEIQGKQFLHEEKGERYREAVVKTMEEWVDRVDSFVLAGPGFEKEGVWDKLPEQVRKKTVVEGTSVTGRAGVSELLRRGVISHVEKNDRLSKETEAVERFLTALARREPVTYGREHVDRAVELGAVAELLVLEGKEDPTVFERVERMGGTVLIIHGDHESGEKLRNLSGIAAFLRYPIE